MRQSFVKQIKANSKLVNKQKKPPTKLSKQAKITRMLLQKIPQTPIPQPYFSIPSPEPFTFPLGQTMLQGIKLLQNYFPEQTNIKIRNKLKGRIQRLSRYKDVYCVLGKGGKGMVIGQQFLDVRGVTAYCYGPNYFIVAYDDLRLDVYSINLKLIKSLKNFTQRKITFLKILSTPQSFENIILLSNCGNDVMVHRIQKSMFSGLSHKFFKKIINNLQFPVTQMIQIPNYFKYYLRKDPNYKQCSLIAISAINCIWILKVNHLKLHLDSFIQLDHYKRVDQIGTNSLSWGETTIQSSTRDLKGDKLVLTCSFGPKVYFIILKQVQKYSQDVSITTKCQWLESFPFVLQQQKNVAFCQFMKKSQLLLVTDDNFIIILSTRSSFQIFDKQIRQEDIQCIKQEFNQNLEARTVALIPKRNNQKVIVNQKSRNKLSKNTQQQPQSLQQHLKNLKKQIQQIQQQQSQFYQENQEQFQLLNKQPIVTYADTFQYEYPSDQIYYLTQKQFGVYVYCDWQRISDHMKVQQRYQSVMVFLIAIFKKVNKFDLGMGDPTLNKQTIKFENQNQQSKEYQLQKFRQKQLSEYIQLLTIQFISNKLLKIKDIPEILDNIIENEQFFKLIIIPIEFLCQTDQFTFLFEVIKDKIISSLIPFSNRQQDNQISYARAENIFYTALSKFIQHGKIKFIPDTQLQEVMNWYLGHNQSQMVDRLAIYFDLTKIDQNIVVQCLLQNNLVVSLAHICTQGNQSLFVTPFVKFWGVSENYKRMKKYEQAAAYALRSLWYMKLCLQRNWILKQYSLQRYAKMIGILSKQFLNEKILVGLLQLRPQYCLQTLSEYFTIQNSQIVNQMQNIQFPVLQASKWIEPKYQNQQLQLLLTTIDVFIKKTFKSQKSQNSDYKRHSSIFLSRIIIYKTVKYTSQKCFEMLIDLIESSKFIKEINYGLQQKMIEEFRQQINTYCQIQDQSQFQQILAARYIVKTLTLVYYDHQNFIMSRLYSLYEKSLQYRLIDLQAQICYLQNNYSNCLQTYLRTTKKSHKMLIYEFLESCFKRLILQKRRQQKQQLSGCIKSQIKNLVLLHPRKTKSLIQNYIPQIHEQLIQALKDDDELQLDYLNDIMNDEYNPNLKQSLSQTSILRYIQLMSQYQPQNLLQTFKKNLFFPIEQSLKICQQYQVYDCIQYLYERMGCIAQAVKIAALRIDKILKQRNNYQQENMLPYIQIKQILDNAIEICKKNHSQQIWQALLDSSIQLYRKYLENKQLPQDQLEIFFFINGQIMQNLASNCSVNHTIHLLQTKYNNLGMGGKMTKAFVNILQDLSHNINILYLSTNLMQLALRRQLQRQYEYKLSCYRTDWDCQTCRFPIDYRDQQIHFQCGHAYHKECVVCQQPMTCVACLMRKSDQFEYYLNTLNPKFPKIKKVNELFQKYADKRLQMSEIFKIQEFEQGEKQYQDGQRIVESIQKKKKQLFQQFDQKVHEIETGNRRVEDQLTYQ